MNPEQIPASIAFLGYGEAARAFRDSLARRRPQPTFHAFDVKLQTSEAAAMRAAMAADGVAAAENAAALGVCDWIISAVTADQSLEAIRPLAPGLKDGALVIDVNSVSPGRKQTTRAAVAAAGGRYLDMAVMAPVHPKGHATPVLIAGDCTADVAGALAALGFSFDIAGPEAGQATAIKMVRSMFVKGLEAITVETLRAAAASGCRETVLKSLEDSYPGLNWAEHEPYVFERTRNHGARRAAEMRECAATLDDLGLIGDLARAVAAVQDREGASGD